MILEIKNRGLPSDLRDLILSRKCFVFIGSGLSFGSYGSWKDLVNKLCEQCGSPCRVSQDHPVDSFLDAAQDAKNTNQDEYFAYLGHHFGRVVGQSSSLYEILLSLPFSQYLTVNFDPTLASKARFAKNPCHHPAMAYPNLYLYDTPNRSISYLHGFIGVGETPVDGKIVLTKDEFESAYSVGANVFNFFVPILENEPVLFIGCELREPVMKYLFNLSKRNQEQRKQVSKGAKNGPPQKYILLPKPIIKNDPITPGAEQDPDELVVEKEKHYQDLGIKPVWFDSEDEIGDPYTLLNVALEELADLPNMTPKFDWGDQND